MRVRWRRSLAWVGGLLIAGGLFTYLGLYNVAASSGHLNWVKALLDTGMRRSVTTWSLAAPSPPADLDSRHRVAIGAAHYHGGCANCHGTPFAKVNAVHDQMLPPPPKLAALVYDWSPGQLFWIVRHGIKYTGMPFWSGIGRDDEVWSVVAFLQVLPGLDRDAYRELVDGNTTLGDSSASSMVRRGNISANLTACDRCHETDTAGPISALVPRLAGQSPAYLARALRNYRSDQRQSGFMEPIATELTDEEIGRFAAYYGALTAPRHADLPSAEKAAIQRGRTLARAGDPARGVPPCRVCHDENALPRYPRLAAQSAPYMAARLHAWRRGNANQHAAGRLMSVIAQRLSDEQVSDASAYFQSLTLGARPGDAP